jgi:hypothetical protein
LGFVYLVLWVSEARGFDKSRHTITLVDEHENVLPFTLFRLFKEGAKTAAATRVTDRHGEAYVLVPGGKYVMQVPTPRNPEGVLTHLNLPQGVASRSMTVHLEY